MQPVSAGAPGVQGTQAPQCFRAGRTLSCGILVSSTRGALWARRSSAVVGPACRQHDTRGPAEGKAPEAGREEGRERR